MSNSSNTGLKVALGIAIALIIGVGAYTFSLYNESEATKTELTAQKEDLTENLNKSLEELNSAIEEKGLLTSDLEDKKIEVENLISNLEQSELNVKNLRGYVSKYNTLKKQMAVVMKENDALKVENKYLETSLDSTNTELQNNKMFSDSLALQNDALVNVVESATILNTARVKANGVVVKRNGRIIETEKARKADKLRLCFTVAKNGLVASGDKSFFIQVLDPSGTILGANEAVIFEDQTINYSLISSFNYEAKNLDICEYLPKTNEKEDFAKGTYKLNIFDRNRLVSSTTLILE